MSTSPNRSMFWRLWLRAITVKRPQAILSVASLLVGAATISTLLNLYSDVRRKMTEEFSAYGANVVLAPRHSGRDWGPHPASSAQDGQLLPAQTDFIDQHLLDRLGPIKQQVKGFISVPRLDAVVRVTREAGQGRVPEFITAVATGGDFGALRGLNPGWRVTGDAGRLPQHTCVVGSNLASRLGVKLGDRITVEPGAAGDHDSESGGTAGSSALTGSQYKISSIVSSGATEDNQVFIPVEALQNLMAVKRAALPASSALPVSQSAPTVRTKISLVEIYVPGAAPEVERVIRELNQAFAGTTIDVRPVRRILYSEGNVLAMIRGLVLWLTGLILVIVALCVTATMTAIVLERRKDIAVMKALGASNGQVMSLLLAQGATLGVLAGIAGCFAGGVLASELGRRLFGVALHWAWWAWPLVCGTTVLLALAASFSPVRSARNIEPAVILKGG